MLAQDNRMSSANCAILGNDRAPSLFCKAAKGGPMDNRIEAFLQDVLALEGEISHLIRQRVRRHLTICEKQFRDAVPNKRMKDTAARVCRGLCRARMLDEIRRFQGQINRGIPEDRARRH